MVCPKCGAENPDNASFCRLCLNRFEARRAPVRPMLAASGPDWARENASAHEWYVKRRADYAEAVAKGLPTESSTYALAAFDAQLRYTRAIWWASSVFTLFAGLAMLRVGLFDWTATGAASGGMGASVLLQSVLIGCVGIAAACALAAFVSGSEAWRATLVNALFWSVLAVLSAAIAVFGGSNGLIAMSVVALGVVAVTAIVPLTKERPTRTIR